MISKAVMTWKPKCFYFDRSLNHSFVASKHEIFVISEMEVKIIVLSFLILLEAALFVISTIGNVLVIIVMTKQKALRKASGYNFIIAIAVTDLNNIGCFCNSIHSSFGMENVSLKFSFLTCSLSGARRISNQLWLLHLDDFVSSHFICDLNKSACGTFCGSLLGCLPSDFLLQSQNLQLSKLDNFFLLCHWIFIRNSSGLRMEQWRIS